MHERLVTEVFTTLEVDYEIIFVNDASPDDAEQVPRQHLYRHAIPTSRWITPRSSNFGSQSAFTGGMPYRHRGRRGAARR